MARCRILIADSHDIVRRSVRSVLEDLLSCSVVAETTTGSETVARTIELEPDIVILDISLPDLHGVDASREIARLAPGVDVIVLSMRASRPLARLLHDAGVAGSLPKIDLGRKLVHLIRSLIARRAAARGRQSMFPQEFFALRSDRPEVDPLTPREREVLQLLAEGRTNKQIGLTLAISAKTVETHRARIMSKLQLRSIAELVRFAIRHRIISA